MDNTERKHNLIKVAKTETNLKTVITIKTKEMPFPKEVTITVTRAADHLIQVIKSLQRKK